MPESGEEKLGLITAQHVEEVIEVAVSCPPV
jgi:hypothetical protein